MPPDHPPADEPSLFDRVSRSVVWNTLLLPVVSLCGLVTSIVIRRRYGLDSGAYDALLGLASTVLFYSSLGIPTSMMKLLPERQADGGRAAVWRLLRRGAALRLGVVVAAAAGLELAAVPLARMLDLGADGPASLRWLALVLVARAVLDLSYYVLYAFLEQLPVNLLTIAQSILDPLLVAAAVGLGYGIPGVVAAVGASAAIVAAIAVASVARTVGRLPAEPRGPRPERPPGWHFSAFDYLIELARYFGTADFGRTALAFVLGSRGQVAVFSVGFYFAFLSVNLVASVFRGVYRPMYAHLRAQGRFAEVARPFAAVTKAQLALLLPAAAGVLVLVPDFLTLFYGAAFAPSATISRLLILLLATETAFNQSLVVLTVDERYRAVLSAMAIQVACAPLVLAAALGLGLEAAAFLLGAGRAATTLFAYVACRRRYGVRYPWAFGARTAAVAATMGVLVALARFGLGGSPVALALLVALGAAIYAVGLRYAAVLDADDLELVARTEHPAAGLLVRWLDRGAR